MALQSIPPYSVPFGYIPRISYAPDFSNYALIDAAGEKYASIFEVPKAGDITHLCFLTAAVSNSQTLRCGLETLDASGNPSGTQYGGSAVGTQAAPAASTYYEVALGTAATVTAGMVGNVIALVLQFDGTTGSVQFRFGNGINHSLPHEQLYTTSWAKTTSRIQLVGIKYSDGTYGAINTLALTTATIATSGFNSGSTPDERGNRFSLAFPATCSGIWAVVAAGTTSTFDLILYEGTTALKTISVDPTHLGATTGLLLQLLFPAAQNLTANTVYTVAVKPTSANNITMYQLTVTHNNVLDTIMGGKEIYQATRTDAGAWTTTNTVRMLCGPLLSAFDDATGGGGGPVSGNIRGGFVN